MKKILFLITVWLATSAQADTCDRDTCRIATLADRPADFKLDVDL